MAVAGDAQRLFADPVLQLCSWFGGDRRVVDVDRRLTEATAESVVDRPDAANPVGADAPLDDRRHSGLDNTGLDGAGVDSAGIDVVDVDAGDASCETSGA